MPLAPKKNSGIYLEFSRQPQDLALVNVAAVADATKKSVVIAVGGLFERPIRIEADFSDPLDNIVGEIKISKNDVFEDQFASIEHKFDILRELIKKATRTL